jgi:hypothetical protein
MGILQSGKVPATHTTFLKANPVQNDHKWGDLWNGEDLSIQSVDDTLLPRASPNSGLPSINPSSASLGASYSGETLTGPSSTINPSNLKEALKSPSIEPQRSLSNPDDDLRSHPGLRAAESYVRPSPIRTHGSVDSHGFDLKNVTFSFTLSAPSPTPEAAPTEIFLPEFHFPYGGADVSVSGGRWRIDIHDVGGDGYQVLSWWHGEGEQWIKVKGVKHKPGSVEVVDEKEDGEVGYFEMVRRSVFG